MKKIFYILAFVCCQAVQAQTVNDHTISFDEGWLFYKGDTAGAQNPQWNDKAWRKVDLPHDWSIEDLPGTQSPFDPEAISGVSGGFTTGGTGWYRKSFQLAAADAQKLHYLQV